MGIRDRHSMVMAALLSVLLLLCLSPALAQGHWVPTGGRHVKNVQAAGEMTPWASPCAACVACQLLLMDVSCCAVYSDNNAWKFLRKKPVVLPTGWTECIRVPNCIDGNGICQQWREGAIDERSRQSFQKEHPLMQGDWPYEGLVPNTKAHRAALLRREAMLMQVPVGQRGNVISRWMTWCELSTMSLLRNFSETGFAVVDAPKHLFERLRGKVERVLAGPGLESLGREGASEELMSSDLRFLDTDSSNGEIMEEMLDMHAEWAGLSELQPVVSYGLRIYRNQSRLMFHNDRANSHIISSILHIAHKYDDEEEPWPIEIEDHKGILHAVALLPGQMLLYESAKCTHGRPLPFKGDYYTSLFTHYRPVEWNLTTSDAAIGVPNYWLETWSKLDFLKAHASSTHFTRDELKAIWDETLAGRDERYIVNTGFGGDSQHWFPHREFHDGRSFGHLDVDDL